MRQTGEIIGKVARRILEVFSEGYGEKGLGGACVAGEDEVDGGLLWRRGRLSGLIYACKQFPAVPAP